MITIYSRSNPPCMYCEKAKNLVKTKGVEHEIKTVGEDLTVEELREMFPNARTFPIVLEDGNMIGGCNELENHLLAQGVAGMSL